MNSNPNQLTEGGISRNTKSFGLSLSLASVVNGLLVVAKEKSPAVMAGMQKLTGHHWVTHAVIVLGVFGIFGLALARLNGGNGPKTTAGGLIGLVVSGVLAGGVIIMGFYLLGG
jgi:predicted transporter